MQPVQQSGCESRPPNSQRSVLLRGSLRIFFSIQAGQRDIGAPARAFPRPNKALSALCYATEMQCLYFGGIKKLCCATEMAWRVIPLFLAMRLASPPIHHQHQTTPWVVHWPFAPQPQVSNSVSSLTKSQHTPSPSDDKSHRCRALGCSPRAPHFSVQNNVVPGIGPYLYQGLDVLCTWVRIRQCTGVRTL